MFADREGAGERESRRKKRLVLFAVLGLAPTTIVLLSALSLGAFGYQIRRHILHEGRLEKLLAKEPTVYQVTEGLREKAPLMASPEDDVELDRLASRWPARRDVILEKGNHWPLTRVHDGGDMIYFIYFDAEGIMRDFVYVSSSEYRGR